MVNNEKNDVQIKLTELGDAGWSMSAIADELGVNANSVLRWRSGYRYPENSKAVLIVMDALLQKKPPPKRRYPEGHYLQRRKAEQG